MNRVGAIVSVVLVTLSLAPSGAHAHPLRFGTLDVEERQEGEVRVHLRFSGSERHPDSAQVVVPEGCIDREPPVAAPIRYGVERRRRLRCPPGALARGPVGVRGIGEDAGGDAAQVILRVTRADGTTTETVLDATSPVWRTDDAGAGSNGAPDASAVVLRYGSLGVEHILLGFDHLLFLAVLLLMIRERRALLIAVTSFTVGHSLTLALAVMDVLRVPPAAVEAAIAISIAVVAAEAIRRRRAEPAGVEAGGASRRSAALVPAAFGLVHGLGFAGALRELGVPADRLVPALVSFNLGVELGQLLFVGAVVALVLAARRAVRPSSVPSRLAPSVVAYGAGVVAVWLCLDRVLALG